MHHRAAGDRRRAPAGGAGAPTPSSTASASVVAARGMAGKFSIVPSSSYRGRRACAGSPATTAGTRAWLDTARRRLGGAVRLLPGDASPTTSRSTSAPASSLAESEHAWSQTQDRHTLTPYVAHALRLLRQVGRRLHRRDLALVLRDPGRAGVPGGHRRRPARRLPGGTCPGTSCTSSTTGPDAPLGGRAPTGRRAWWPSPRPCPTSGGRRSNSPRTDRAWIDGRRRPGAHRGRARAAPSGGCWRPAAGRCCSPTGSPSSPTAWRRACGRSTRSAGASQAVAGRRRRLVELLRARRPHPRDGRAPCDATRGAPTASLRTRGGGGA